MREQRLSCVASAILVSLTILVDSAPAQLNIDWIGNSGDYSDTANWNGGIIPLANFDEVGRINNGGTAIVTNQPDSPGGIVLGAGGGESGMLEIQAGGNFTVESAGGLAPGSVVVGQSGTGHLIVAGGGSLTADSLSSGGNAASSIVLGESGNGNASVDVLGSANLNRNLRVVGPDVSFFSQGLTLGGTLTSVITGLDHSALNVDGTATVAGALSIEFDGHTPDIGQSWDLVDATGISGNFTSITSNIDAAAGRRFIATSIAGGMNGFVMRLQLEQILALSVDRGTGAISIINVDGGSDVEWDGYAVQSPSGALNTNAWTSLQDQGVGNFEEANPSATQLAELDPTSFGVVTGGTTFMLGEVFNPSPAAFGDPVEDLTFTYGRPDGAVIQGQVNYERFGPSLNNLVLAVDPESGQGTLLNASPFDIQIDGYAIRSATGALLAADGSWNSLQDQSMSAWEEANVSANQLAELNPTASSDVNAGADVDLGTLFDTAGARDLTLEFFISGEPTARQGLVIYDAADVGPSLPGDYNDSGGVEQGDLDLVLLHWGDDALPIPAGWINDLPSGAIDQDELDGVLLNWGDTIGTFGAASAVPEPMTALLALLVGAILCVAKLRPSSPLLGEER